MLKQIRDWTRHHPVIDLVVTIAMAIVIAYCVQAWIVKPYRIPSESMTDTLLVSDRIIAARFLYHLKDPSRGDIIVFQPNGRGGDAFRTDEVADTVFVKRLIGMPGEIIGAQRRQGLRLRRRGGAGRHAADRADAGLPLPRRGATCSSTQDDFGPETIPDDRYFMMGDNRADSDDSRNWGPIKRDQIIGRAFMTYWPLNRIGFY